MLFQTKNGKIHKITKRLAEKLEKRGIDTFGDAPLTEEEVKEVYRILRGEKYG